MIQDVAMETLPIDQRLALLVSTCYGLVLGVSAGV